MIGGILGLLFVVLLFFLLLNLLRMLQQRFNGVRGTNAVLVPWRTYSIELIREDFDFVSEFLSVPAGAHRGDHVVISLTVDEAEQLGERIWPACQAARKLESSAGIPVSYRVRVLMGVFLWTRQVTALTCMIRDVS